jgi:hypothetical protein
VPSEEGARARRVFMAVGAIERLVCLSPSALEICAKVGG